MEESGAFVAITFIMKSNGRCTYQFWPKHVQSVYTACMAHVSHQMWYGWLLPLLNLLQQLPGMVLRMTMNLLDQEDRFLVIAILAKPSSRFHSLTKLASS